MYISFRTFGSAKQFSSTSVNLFSVNDCRPTGIPSGTLALVEGLYLYIIYLFRFNDALWVVMKQPSSIFCIWLYLDFPISYPGIPVWHICIWSNIPLTIISFLKHIFCMLWMRNSWYCIRFSPWWMGIHLNSLDLFV